MSITQSAIEKKRITGVALLFILVLGLMNFNTMPRAEDPGFTIRTALILTHFPGASPERVEQLVTDKLEKRIQEMPEVGPHPFVEVRIGTCQFLEAALVSG